MLSVCSASIIFLASAKTISLQPKSNKEGDSLPPILRSGKNVLDSVGRFLEEKTAPVRRQAREHPFLAAGAVAVGIAGIAVFTAVALNGSSKSGEPPEEPPPDL